MLLCVPDVHCYSHSINSIFHVHVQTQRELSSKPCVLSQPWGETFSNPQTSYCAIDKDHKLSTPFSLVDYQILPELLSFPPGDCVNFTQHN